MKTCPSQKRMYPTKEIAEDALIEAHTRFEYGKQGGPIAVYLCDDCGYFHFTSQGTPNKKLKDHIESGKLRTQKLAQQWESKIKKRF
jgi:hypothetical protein